MKLAESRRETLAAGVLGLAVGIAVCIPWLVNGWLMLLDWVPSPHPPLLPKQVDGLAGGLISGFPLVLFDNLSSHVFGQKASIFEIFVFLIVASISMSKLLGGSRLQHLSASLFFCINPFVFDRLYVGQIGVLFGYAFLPLAIKSLIDARGTWSLRAWVRVGLWWVVLISCGPHFAWIFAVPVAVVALFNLAKPKLLLGLAITVLLGLIATSYVLVAGTIGGVGVQVGQRNLLSFQTSPDPHFGLIANVLGLYGFWRLGPTLAKQVITGWPILLLGILAVTAYGYWNKYKRANKSTDKQEVLIIAVSGVIGLILAMGSQGPFGWLFSFAYLHIPYFNIMREPEKFSSLLAVAESVGFGWGIGAMYSAAKGKSARIITVATAIVLVIAYEPLVFFGLAGQIKTSEYPSSWYSANKLMGNGNGMVLALPWHLYLSYPFTQERVVANLSPGFFSRSVISGDNVQLPNIPTSSTVRRSLFLQFAFDNGNATRYFGSILAPLGIKYIVLEKTVDWRNFYWLNNQSDLKLLMNSNSIEVFQNLAYAGPGYRTGPAITVPNWGSIIALSETNQLLDKTVLATQPGPGPIVAPNLPSSSSARSNNPLVQAKHLSNTKYSIASGESGWIQLSEPFEPGWTLRGRPGVQLAEGNIGWPSSGKASVAFFSPVYWVWGSEALSLLTVLAAGGYLVLARIRKWPERVETSEQTGDLPADSESPDGALSLEDVPNS